MIKVNGMRTDARKGVSNNQPKVMREQARDYLRLAAMTQIPALAQVFRAKAHALYARAALAEQAIGHPIYFALT
ncbi:MAG TPA: hypothetical protein VJ779_10310 [Acetobacteraceae bacterium]|nr:hypothetical protein [Acetobacteraceae bacterium]